MNSIEDIWAGILEILSKDLTTTALNTWFGNAKPLDIDEKDFVLIAESDFKRSIIVKRFSDTICEALTELFACDFELLVLTEGDEVEEWKARKGSNNVLPEMDAYTFNNFIVGSSNKLAHAAAISVSEKPGSMMNNPLFIYGNSGLGKTHLLMAIGQAIHSKDSSMRIEYIKGDEFTNKLVDSIQSGNAQQFRERYRNVDLFLVDDIQFIAGRERTQEEFFHTFNNIYEAGHQIVITSDRPPMEMNKLEDRLRTRFEGGLMVDISPPDFETRMAIINNKATALGLYLPTEVVEFIANTITSNIRQIEGVINRLTAFHELLNNEISISSVKKAISDVIRVGTFIPTPSLILEETARYYQLTVEAVKGQNRSKNTAMARQVSMYLMRTLTNLSLVDIGEQHDNRNHSTVISSIKKVEDLLKTDPSMAATIRDITSNINSKS